MTEGSKSPFDVAVDDFCTALRRRQIKGSTPSAHRTAELLRILITSGRHADGEALIAEVRHYGAKMQEAKPLELAIGNMVRRVLSLIRDEHLHDVAERGELSIGTPAEVYPAGESVEGGLSKALRESPYSQVGLRNLLDVGPALPYMTASGSQQAGESSAPDGASASKVLQRKMSRVPQWQRKGAVIETVNELIEELDLIESQIVMQGLEYIHANEVILTMNWSSTTSKFLQAAAKKRSYQVVVAESAPAFDGHIAAKQLAQSNIATTVIPDASVFAMMARVNKVIISAHAVLANGSIIAPAGTHLVALAAQRHAVPFVVLVGLHKLSPLFPHAPNIAFNDFRSPAGVVGFDIVPDGTSNGCGNDSTDSLLHVDNPQYDYIPPELVTIIVTDTGGYTPSYVYRLLAEYYKREDYILEDTTKGVI